jgi:hypothetical protein
MNIELSHIATVHNRSGQELQVFHGHNDDIVNQLVEKSRETDIVARCRKDSEKRFTAPEAFHVWRQKGIGGRALYPTLDAETGDLSAVVWLGVEPFEGEAYRQKVDGVVTDRLMPNVDPSYFAWARRMSDTFALRTYESQKGEGISRDITIQTIAHYVTNRTCSDGDLPKFTGIHLETDIDNIRSRKVYQNLLSKGVGFKPVAENLDANRVAMVFPDLMASEVVMAADALQR